MSFYGNISNAGKTQMSFDRVYPNRKIMEENASTDGVFVGRFVLVEYDDNTYSHRAGYIKDTPNYNDEQNGTYLVYTDSECKIPFNLSESNENGYELTQGDLIIAEKEGYYYYFQFNGKIDSSSKDAYFNYITSSTESFDNNFSDYAINYNEDKKYAKEKNYPFTTGWDSTVWRKVYKNSKEQYQMIASLSSVTPKFTLTAEAPTIIPTTPHFGINSTNINYDLHYQPNWGLRVKRTEGEEKSDTIINTPYKAYDPDTKLLIEEDSYNGAIYFNKNGFNPKIRALDETTEDEITILPTGNSGQKYIVHDENGNFLKTVKEDTQEITLNLPSIGNIMSNVWDVVYGPIYDENGKIISNNRDMNLSWDDNTSGNRLVTEDPEGNGYQYNPERIQTIAGSINSVHDLMGRIIINSPPPDGDIRLANANKIYYGEYNSDISDNKGFYFKDKTYELKPFKDINEQNEYVGKRVYYDLTQFSPNVYYTYSNRNFYLDKSIVPTQDTLYYKLGDPIEVSLKQWQPETSETDLDTGEEIITKQYSYYKNEDLDYIKDKSEQPDQNKVYYQINTTKVTNPKHINENDNSKIIKFFAPTYQGSSEVTFDLTKIDQEDRDGNGRNITKIKEGYFYIKTDKNNRKILSSFSNLTNENYDQNAEYFYLKEYAVSGTVGSDNDTQSEVAYILYTETSSDGLTSYKIGPDFYSLLNGENGESNYNKYLKPNQIKMIPFEDNKYYYEFKGETVDRYNCIHNLDKKIIDETICYTIEATYDGGPIYPEDYTNNVFFYKKNLYFIKDKDNYLLSKSVNMDSNVKYYLLTDENNKLLELDSDRQDGTLSVTPEKVKFYEPGKYYYESLKFSTEILDNDIIMKTSDEAKTTNIDGKELIYYTLQEAYVIQDTAGILKAGSVWNKNKKPPDTVILGKRIETYKWTELKGFAEQLNTIHGLILEINKLFKFNDTLTRDRTTVQGCINQINDIINTFGEINPSDTVIMNNYGQFAGANYKTDNWIDIYTDYESSNPSITVNHSKPTGNTTQIGGTIGQILKFGGSFKSYNFGIDEKGHINKTKTASVNNTLPSLAITNGTTGNVLTSLGVSADGQSIVANSSDIGTLQLASYTIATAETAISATDTINSAFGKLEYRLDILQAGATQEGSVAYQIAKIVNENNNGSIDTLNEIAEWIVNDETGVAKMNADISGLKTDVSELKEQIQTASTGLLDRTSSLETLVGTEAVSTQINKALFIGDKAIYAKASDLEDLASNTDAWNEAEPNVQSDWSELDTTSDAYILNKPDLSNMIETTSQFDYTVGDTTNQLTIAQLVAKVAELEATIQALTAST